MAARAQSSSSRTAGQGWCSRKIDNPGFEDASEEGHSRGWTSRDLDRRTSGESYRGFCRLEAKAASFIQTAGSSEGVRNRDSRVMVGAGVREGSLGDCHGLERQCDREGAGLT